MKELGKVWLKSLGLTLIVLVFSQISIDKFSTVFAPEIYFLLPIIVEIFSIIMLFKIKTNIWKKIIFSFILPSSLYIYLGILIIIGILIPLSKTGLSLGN